MGEVPPMLFQNDGISNARKAQMLSFIQGMMT
jgi:hypothetical protein